MTMVLSMSMFSIRSDMEGLYGVVSWEEVIPGTPAYEKSRFRLSEEINALCSGLHDGGANQIDIYDEHYFGMNVDPGLLQPGAILYRGKPPYTEQWPGGLTAECSGLILQGYHAMHGTKGGILPHTYEPDICAIRINGRLVGEIGIEAAIAGELNVPLALYIGDAHGAAEAKALVPEVETVVVKTGLGDQMGLCRGWADVRIEIIEKAKRVARKSPAGVLRFEPPITMEIDLLPGPYRETLFQDEPSLEKKNGTVTLRGPSVTATWANYWTLKDRVLAKLKKAQTPA